MPVFSVFSVAKRQETAATILGTIYYNNYEFKQVKQ